MQRLDKFNKYGSLKKKALIGVYAFLIIGIILMGTTYAVYQTSDEVLFINARVGKFNANDIELAMKLDGNDIESPPSKDNYVVTVTCDNADGEWDKTKWAAVIGNISTNKVKCEVNFSTPEATLTDVTATSDKTTISLSYTAGGIGTNTTCVYGTDTNYGNTVEGVTNSKCSISGLSMDTTYYYKVCAKNATGEVCKEGSIKTKPNTTPFTQSDVGKYVTMTPTATSYTLPDELSGCTGITATCKQNSINPSELNLWRVIKVNSDGTVEMVSDKVSSTAVYFRGKAGYQNLVGGLNTIASRYTDGKHVLRTRHIGYSNQTEKITDTSKLSQTKAPWVKNTSEYNQWTGCNTSSYLCGTDESKGAGDIGYTTDYSLVNGVYGSMTANKVGTSTATLYWLASRYFGYGDDHDWGFGGRYVNSGGDLANYWPYEFIGSKFISNSDSFAVRPIVTLKSSTEISSGNGTESSPYILN